MHFIGSMPLFFAVTGLGAGTFKRLSLYMYKKI
jgi:hypothetical protein